MADYSSYLPKISVSVCGREWTLHRPEDLETLWSAMTEDDMDEDERLPYWVELWPASIVLADWLQISRQRIHSKCCLDMGCGLGLTAIVASSLGAKVLALDYEAEALRYAHINAAANSTPQPLWTAMDWRFPALAPQTFDFVWGGDIMYERRFVDPVLRCIDIALKPGGVVWIAEPNRDVYQFFRSALFHAGWSASPVHRTRLPALYAQPEKVSVTLWEIRKT